jgi:putative DNA primase/helicase
VAVRDGSPVVRGVKGGALDYTIDREMTFVGRAKGKKGEGQERKVSCPQRVQGMIAGIGGDRVLMPLEGILQVPSMRPDGTIIEAPGYDPATGYYLASRVKLSNLNPNPTQTHAVNARKYLQDLFAPTVGDKLGFPWRRGWDETIVPIALAMSALVRPAVGCVPAFVIDASTPGSGKGKVVGVCSIIATGDEPGRAGWPTSPEEQEKTLGAYASMAPPIIAWDNVRGRISNTHLENALTTPHYDFRVLGFSDMMRLPFRCICTFTGNNCGLGGDMPRRCIVCRLEPQTEHPDRYAPENFRHPHIENHTRTNRAKIVSALLTIPRAFVLAGMPDQGVRMGSFDQASGGLGWIELVGGALKWAGAGDITEFSGKENIEEPEEWGHARTLLGSWPRIDTAGLGVPLSAVLSLIYPQDVIEALRKGAAVPKVHDLEWGDQRAAIQSLSRCPDRAIPDSTKLGNAIKPFLGRWFHVAGHERRFVHAISPATGKAFVPARWKVEER